MHRHRKLLIAIVGVLLTACFHWPQTPDEFRQQIPSATFGKVESTDVKRPLREVGKTFQAKAHDCLAVTIKTTEGARTVYRTLKPTVLVKADKVELYLQQTYEGGGVITPGHVPDGGAYFIVTDATPLDRGHTHLVMYGPSIGDGASLMKVLAGWASGDLTGCPDLTK